MKKIPLRSSTPPSMWILFLPFLALLACQGDSKKAQTKGATKLSVEGRAFSGGAMAHAQVEARELDDRGHPLRRASSGKTDETGHFHLDNLELGRSYSLSAWHDARHPIEIILPRFGANGTEKPIIVSPASSLSSAYAKHRIAHHGETLVVARANGDKAIGSFLSIGGIGQVEPAAPPAAPATGEKKTSLRLDEPQKLMALLSAFERLSSQLSLQQGLEPGTHLRTDVLVHALSEDLAADGHFDGKGPDGQPIALAGASLSPELLRPGLSAALLDTALWLYGRSSLGPKEFCSMAGSIADHQGGLFTSAGIVPPRACQRPEVLLSGTVHLVGPVPNAQLQVFAISQAGGESHLLDTTTTDSEGHWSLRVPSLSEVLEVRTADDHSPSLSALSQLSFRENHQVHVHPSSHLVASRAAFLMGRGKSTSAALRLAERDFADHFDSPLSQPQRPDIFHLMRTAGTFRGEHRLWLIHEALCHLANEKAQATAEEVPDEEAATPDGEPTPPRDCGITFQRWLDALRYDLVVDGVADGRRGEELIHGVPIRTETLREDLHEALYRHIAENGAWFTDPIPQQISSWLDRLSNASSPLVQVAASSAAHQEPKFVGCKRITSKRTLEGLAGPYGRPVELLCEWDPKTHVLDARATPEQPDISISDFRFSAATNSLSFLVTPHSDLVRACAQTIAPIRLIAQTKDNQMWGEEIRIPFDYRRPSFGHGKNVFRGDGEPFATAWTHDVNAVHLSGVTEPFANRVCAQLERQTDAKCQDLSTADINDDGKKPWNLSLDWPDQNPGGERIQLSVETHSGIQSVDHLVARPRLGGPSIENKSASFQTVVPDLSSRTTPFLTRSHFDSLPRPLNERVWYGPFDEGAEYRVYADAFDLPTLDLAVARAKNLPIITIEVNDRPASEVFQGEVRFRLHRATDKYGPRDRSSVWKSDWQTFPFREGNRFHLPLSYQTLSQNYQNSYLDFTGKKDSTFVKPVPGGGDWYGIEVQATDTSQNTGHTVFSFKTRVFLRPVELTSVDFSTEYRNMPLTKAASEAIRHGRRYANGTLTWPTQASAASWAPETDLSATFRIHNRLLAEKPYADISIISGSVPRGWKKREIISARDFLAQIHRVHGASFGVYHKNQEEKCIALSGIEKYSVHEERIIAVAFHSFLPAELYWPQQDGGTQTAVRPGTVTHFQWSHTRDEAPFTAYQPTGFGEQLLAAEIMKDTGLVGSWPHFKWLGDCGNGPGCNSNWMKGLGRIAFENHLQGVQFTGTNWLEAPVLVLSDEASKIIHHRMTWNTELAGGKVLFRE